MPNERGLIFIVLPMIFHNAAPIRLNKFKKKFENMLHCESLLTRLYFVSKKWKVLGSQKERFQYMTDRKKEGGKKNLSKNINNKVTKSTPCSHITKDTVPYQIPCIG